MEMLYHDKVQIIMINDIIFYYCVHQHEIYHTGRQEVSNKLKLAPGNWLQVQTNRPLACKWKYFDYFLIAVMSLQDALNSRKNVLQPKIRWSLLIKQPSQIDNTV